MDGIRFQSVGRGVRFDDGVPSHSHAVQFQVIAWKYKMMDWIPVVFVTFKVLVLGTGMFFAVKWHYDQGKKEKEKRMEMRAVLRATGKAIAIFALLLVVLVGVTFALLRVLGL
jgi:heme/copper-type cytochrome/quinol oxidase subunit 2